MNTKFYHSLILPAVLLACVWLPSRAQAQFSFTLNPSTLTAPPGTNDLTFSGTLTNSGASILSSDNDPFFQLYTGPSGQDLTAFPIYLDNFYAPDSLAPGQTDSQIFSVDIDPSAMLGQYTGNISFGYSNQLSGQDVTINVAPSPVPEDGSEVLLVLGLSYIGFALWRQRLCRST